MKNTPCSCAGNMMHSVENNLALIEIVGILRDDTIQLILQGTVAIGVCNYHRILFKQKSEYA